MRVELTNTAGKLCVIGDPVLHSRSPLLQNAMIQALGLDYIYLCQPVKAGDTARFLDAAATLGYVGFNATMPHKEALVPLMDTLDTVAAKCGAVNTVCIKNGKYYGYNTDGGGFLAALADIGADPAGKRVLLLGAGGAARAVAAALSEAGATVTVANRTVEKAQQIAQMDPANITAAGFQMDALCKLAADSDVLVNCTNLGMAGTTGQFDSFDFVDALPPHAVVCDAIYNPPETALLAHARGRGLVTMNGMGMLLHQAVLALEHFAGKPIDKEKALSAARGAMEG